MPQQKKADLQMLRSALDEWNAELSRLEEETRKAQADERTRYEERIKALREKEEVVERTLKRIFEQKADTWDELKEGVASAWFSFKGSLKEAKSEFEKGLEEGTERKPGPK